MEYAFRLLNPAEEPTGLFRLALIHDPRWKQVEQIVEAGQYGTYRAHVQGALLQLFTPPPEAADPLDYTY